MYFVYFLKTESDKQLSTGPNNYIWYGYITIITMLSQLLKYFNLNGKLVLLIQIDS